MKRICLRIVLAIVLSLMCVVFDVSYVGCSGVTGSDVVMGREFKIRYGQELKVKGEDLKVKFASLLGDSRCPSNVTCIWEGDALVQIDMKRTNATESQIELHTNSRLGGALEGKYQQYVIKLVALDPYPRTDVERKGSDYVATLLVTKEQEAAQRSNKPLH